MNHPISSFTEICKKPAEPDNLLEQRVDLNSLHPENEQRLYHGNGYSLHGAIIKAEWHKPECDA